MSENKKITVMLIVILIIILPMAIAFYIVKPSEPSSDNKLIQECLAKELSCSFYVHGTYINYRVDIDGFERYGMKTTKEALEFIKKIENFNNYD